MADGNKRVHVNSIQSASTELEKHLAITNKPFFGGL